MVLSNIWRPRRVSLYLIKLIIKAIKVMILSDMKVGDEFYMDGLSYPYNNPVKTKCTLIEYKGMNKYVIDSDNCLVLCDGNDKVYLK